MNRTIFNTAKGSVMSCIIVLVWLLFFCQFQNPVYAGEKGDLSSGVQALLKKYPAGAIDSVALADEVLDAVEYEEKVLDYQFGIDMDECTKKFLVTRCYDAKKLQLRVDKAALRTLSVEADRFKRAEKVRQRDLILIDREQDEWKKASVREENRKKYEKKMEFHGIDPAAKEADAMVLHKPYEHKEQDTKTYLELEAGEEASSPSLEKGAYTISSPSGLKNTDTALTPEKRAENVREYEAKQAESIKKQEEILRKTSETQAKRERLKAEQQEESRKKQKVVE